MEIYNTKWRYYIYMVKDRNFERHFVLYATLFDEDVSYGSR